MTRRSFVVAALLVLSVLVAKPVEASALQAALQTGPPQCVPIEVSNTDLSAVPGVLQGSTDATVEEGVAVVIQVENCTGDDVDMDPNAPAETGYRGPGSEGVDETVAVPAEPVDNCVEYFTPFSADPEVTYTPYCVKWRVCGGERVDDIVSGDLAGEESTGQYRSYLDQIIGYMDIGVDLAPSVPAELLDIDPASVSEFLLEQGLGDQPGDDLIPVFYWCADYVTVDGADVFDPVDLASVSFGWDLTYSDVYDIPGATNTLYTLLQARLDLYKPEIGLVPMAELGFTFVQWPTWMFLQNPTEDITLFANNSTDTLRIDLRATLVGVDWYFGDDLVNACTAAEMLPFTDSLDPVDDLPDCHHRFTQLDCQNLTATTRFKIEQMVRTRPSASNHEYPPLNWTDFLDTPTEIELSSTVGNYEIHEIVALNTAQGLSSDEVLARGRAAGTIPEPSENCNYLKTRRDS